MVLKETLCPPRAMAQDKGNGTLIDFAMLCINREEPEQYFRQEVVICSSQITPQSSNVPFILLEVSWAGLRHNHAKDQR
jgi:hypothetical protein